MTSDTHCPSVKRLMQTFNVDKPTATLARCVANVMHSPAALADLLMSDALTPYWPAISANHFSAPRIDQYTPTHWRVIYALRAIGAILGTVAPKALGPTSTPKYEYLNVGDPYISTLVYCYATSNLTIRAWGDIVERHPNW